MAAITAIRKGGIHEEVFVWSPVTNADTMNPVMPSGGFNDRSIQVTGTPGAALVLDVQGSNDPETTAAGMCGLREHGNARLNTLLVTANLGNGDIRQILESSVHVQPVLSGGDGTTSLTVRLKCSRQQ
jgi:hypothetical protein